MIKINLIGDSYSRRATRRRIVLVFALAVFLTIALSAAAGYSLHYAVGRLQQESAQKKELSQEIQEITKRATQLEQQRKNIEPRAQALASLQRGSREAIEVLYAVSASVPSVAWITELRSYEGAIEISGIAPDDKSVSEFVEGLSQHSIFSEVTLGRARPVDAPQGKGKEFIIRAKIVLAGAVQPQSDKEGGLR
jgi:Tfp pilus assembly protein PilN